MLNDETREVRGLEGKRGQEHDKGAGRAGRDGARGTQSRGARLVSKDTEASKVFPARAERPTHEVGRDAGTAQATVGGTGNGDAQTSRDIATHNRVGFVRLLGNRQ